MEMSWKDPFVSSTPLGPRVSGPPRVVGSAGTNELLSLFIDGDVEVAIVEDIGENEQVYG